MGRLCLGSLGPVWRWPAGGGFLPLLLLRALLCHDPAAARAAARPPIPPPVDRSIDKQVDLLTDTRHDDFNAALVNFAEDYYNQVVYDYNSFVSQRNAGVAFY